MKLRVVSTALAIGIVLLTLSGCAATAGASPASCWTMSASVTEDAVGESSAREALSSWVAEASGLTTKLPASDWDETKASDDLVRFQGENDWAAVTHLPGGWMVLGGRQLR